MTASAASARTLRTGLLGSALVCAACLAAAGCRTPSAPPAGSPLSPLPTRPRRAPDAVDRLAHDVAAAALASQPGRAERALLEIDALDVARVSEGGLPSGLVPIAQDDINATIGDPAEYRRLSRELLRRDDLDPVLRARLEQVVADDPMRLAARRIHDARLQTYGGAFNALVAPVSRTLMRGVMLPAALARALLGLGLREHLDDELSVPERQALRHWRRYLAETPDAPDAAEIRARIEKAEGRWNQTQRDRMMRAARHALQHDKPGAAQLLSARALRFLPEDRDALELRAEAERRKQERRAEQARSLEAPARVEPSPPGARALALALLASNGDVATAASALRTSAPDGPWADEAQFAQALALGEAGREREMWSLLERLADAEDARSNLARHARALLEDPAQNPYGAFDDAREGDVADRVGWVLLGPLAKGARDFDLPRPVEWLVDAPTIVTSIVSLPNRLIAYPWLEPWPFGRKPAFHARRYLERYPEGERSDEVRDWLRGFEEHRGSYIAALRVAETDPQADPTDMAQLAERAAEQGLEAARREPRPDFRAAMLRRMAADYPDTKAGHQAGALARRDAELATSQRIRISRGFLLENPRVAGPEGLALLPGLLDDDPSNGELHPEGISFVGGRTLEFAFLGPSGDDDDPPVLRRERVSDERLARTVALLDEVTRRNELLDPDDSVAADAARERFFERARLGIADRTDSRPTARSNYTFLGMRERYGLVRGRESILPVELVIQGSLPDLGLGAFPRIKMPKPTPDAILYE